MAWPSPLDLLIAIERKKFYTSIMTSVVLEGAIVIGALYLGCKVSRGVTGDVDGEPG